MDDLAGNDLRVKPIIFGRYDPYVSPGFKTLLHQGYDLWGNLQLLQVGSGWAAGPSKRFNQHLLIHRLYDKYGNVPPISTRV